MPYPASEVQALPSGGLGFQHWPCMDLLGLYLCHLSASLFPRQECRVSQYLLLGVAGVYKMCLTCGRLSKSRDDTDPRRKPSALYVPALLPWSSPPPQLVWFEWGAFWSHETTAPTFLSSAAAGDS